MIEKGRSVYEPAGPANEALSSWYVRNLVQRTIDQAFKASPPADDGSPEASGAGNRRRSNV